MPGGVMPVAMVDVKVSAALLTRPDVVFTPTAPNGSAKPGGTSTTRITIQ